MVMHYHDKCDNSILKSKLNFYWPTEKLAIEGKKTVFKKENYLVMPHEKKSNKLMSNI